MNATPTLNAGEGRESRRPEPPLSLGNLALDLNTYRAIIDGEVIDVTFNELEVLRVLFGHADRIVPYKVITSELWARSDRSALRNLNVIVHRLRAKLARSWPYLIETVRGRGYGLVISRESKEGHG
jgi:two-component system KDP operon response regulator KdpE